MMRQSVEQHIGMLTCQIIEFQVQLQVMAADLGAARADNERLRTALATTAEETATPS
jgi:hypothetical protein